MNNKTAIEFFQCGAVLVIDRYPRERHMPHRSMHTGALAVVLSLSCPSGPFATVDHPSLHHMQVFFNVTQVPKPSGQTGTHGDCQMPSQEHADRRIGCSAASLLSIGSVCNSSRIASLLASHASCL